MFQDESLLGGNPLIAPGARVDVYDVIIILIMLQANSGIKL